MIRCGRRIYAKDGTFKDPSFSGYYNVPVLTKSSKYGSLGPYILKNEKGQIMENLYQAHKVYKKVPRCIQRYSRYDSTVIWNHPEEIHVNDDEELTDEYWAWRKKLSDNEYAVRYPVGFNGRHKCLYSLLKTEEKNSSEYDYYEQLDYIEARKKVYAPLYIEMVRKQEQYAELLDMLKKGKKLLVIEVDMPHQEDLEYYKEKYGVNDTFIVKDTMECTKKNIDIMLNDPKHPFGHGYCLAMALLTDAGIENFYELF